MEKIKIVPIHEGAISDESLKMGERFFKNSDVYIIVGKHIREKSKWIINQSEEKELELWKMK